jgi:hypothetical protein
MGLVHAMRSNGPLPQVTTPCVAIFLRLIVMVILSYTDDNGYDIMVFQKCAYKYLIQVRFQTTIGLWGVCWNINVIAMIKHANTDTYKQWSNKLFLWSF